ncbi:recombinase family protein, partial [Chloroflexota bacterium]
IVAIYSDDSSAKDTFHRPGFEQMMMEAVSGKFQAILVYHTSRMFRNVADARRYKTKLRQYLGIEVVFISQGKMDPDDPNGFMLEGINELFDEHYLWQLKVYTKMGKKTRAEKGLWNGTLPWGYITDPDTGLPVPHPMNAKGLLMAFEAYATGKYTDREIAELLNREGYRTTGNWGERPFTKDTVNRILKNVFYLGLVKYKGEVFPGQHPALISQELFDKCQDHRARSRPKRKAHGKRKYTYVLAGIACCSECGLTLRCGAGGSRRYYRHVAKSRGYDCSVRDQGIREEELEAAWSEIVAAIKLPEDWQRRIQELIGDADERETIQRERTQIEEKLKRLTELYKDLMIDKEQYRSNREQLQQRLKSLVLPEAPHLIEAGEYLESLGMIWPYATLEEQTEITRVLVNTVTIDVEIHKIISIEPKPIFKLLFAEVCEGLDIDVV